jgi:hypothetical protein
MKSTSRSFCLQVLAIGAALCFAWSAHAATPRENVVHAFRLLKQANHDYDGHRIKAMAELEAAGHDMSLELGGDLPEAERQWKSDAQLQEARHLVREARDKMEREDRERVAAHLDKAIKEIDAALKVSERRQ